jgi:heme-degrading monooxygenase HmoA
MAHMLRAVELVREGADGLIDFAAWREEGGGRLIGLSRWESRAAFEAAVPLITSRRAHRPDEWSISDDEVLLLRSD